MQRRWFANRFCGPRAHYDLQTNDVNGPNFSQLFCLMFACVWTLLGPEFWEVSLTDFLNLVYKEKEMFFCGFLYLLKTDSCWQQLWLHFSCFSGILGFAFFVANYKNRTQRVKLASFKGDQRAYRGNAASHVGAAVLAHVGRSNRFYLDAA